MTAFAYSHPRLVVDLAALRGNYESLQRGTDAVVAPVVKANAYGLGLEAVCKTLAKAGSETFFTANTAEGLRLRELLPGVEIYVLTPFLDCDADQLLGASLKPCLYDVEQARRYLDRARALSCAPLAALHVETGINRLGLEPAMLGEFVRGSLADIEVELVLGHLACSDEPESPMNRLQLERFREACETFPGARASLANSGGIFLGRDYHFDIVRPGIALYGHDPHCDVTAPRVRPVATLEARLGQVRRVAAGEPIGYGADAHLERDGLIGVVLGGYADGVARSFAERGADGPLHVAIDGVAVPLIGRVSMDLFAVDLSVFGQTPPEPGSTVEVFGNAMPIEISARHAGTIPYEVLTRVGTRVERFYVDGNAGSCSS